MYSAEKVLASTGTTTIHFILHSLAQHVSEISLQAYDFQQLTVQLTSRSGDILMTETLDAEDATHRKSYSIPDLEPGTYYCEVSDGFYHQVKEVHISA